MGTDVFCYFKDAETMLYFYSEKTESEETE